MKKSIKVKYSFEDKKSYHRDRFWFPEKYGIKRFSFKNFYSAGFSDEAYPGFKPNKSYVESKFGKRAAFFYWRGVQNCRKSKRK